MMAARRAVSLGRPTANDLVYVADLPNGILGTESSALRDHRARRQAGPATHSVAQRALTLWLAKSSPPCTERDHKPVILARLPVRSRREDTGVRLTSITRMAGLPPVTVDIATIADPDGATVQPAPRTDTVAPHFDRPRRLSAEDVAK